MTPSADEGGPAARTRTLFSPIEAGMTLESHGKDYAPSLVRELANLPKETEWVEFKVNQAEPQEIGEYISALANSARLLGKRSAYVVWGIEDETLRLVGTNFAPSTAKVGNEELESWLLRLLTPKLPFRFEEAEIDGRRFVVLEIEAVFQHPVQFAGADYIRVGSYKKRLKDHPEKERALWRALERQPFEDGVAAARLDDQRTLAALDYTAFFDLQDRPVPTNALSILEALAADDLIKESDAGGWDITNLGAMLFAKKLSEFPSLRRKAVRVIQYRGTSRVDSVKEQVGGRGYASGFSGLLEYLTGILPSNEVIGQALRRTVPMFPELAIREVVANALIHQDFFVTGAGPMIEIFADRIEVTNPGSPLIDTERFLDNAPRSRNEKLASLMRRMGICEERGSGVDKVVAQLEFFQLPAPIFEATDDATRAVLFAHRPLNRMDSADRIRACYLHACLKYVNREYVTNTTIRARFGIDDQNIATASRLIKEAVEAGAIAPYDESAAPKYMKYIPWWAADARKRVVS